MKVIITIFLNIFPTSGRTDGLCCDTNNKDFLFVCMSNESYTFPKTIDIS